MEENHTFISKFRDKLNGQDWIEEQLILEARLGSYVYGANLDNTDIDVRGIFIPPREMVFPFKPKDYVYGFGTQPLKYNMFTKTIENYDVIYYNIVKFFDLLLSNNPNIMNFLFLKKEDCTIHSSISDKILESKGLFLSRKIFTTYNGLAEKCVKDVSSSVENGKAMYLTLRTLIELRDIATNYTEVNLKENASLLKKAKAGDISLDEFVEMVDALQIENNLLELNSPWKQTPNELEVRNLLWECLEDYYKGL